MVVKKAAVKSERSSLKKIQLVTHMDDVHEVVVTGDFTGWSEDGIRLAEEEEGVWETTLQLAPGEYQYRLRVDGEWRDHPEAERRVRNPYGSENCVLTVE